MQRLFYKEVEAPSAGSKLAILAVGADADGKEE